MWSYWTTLALLLLWSCDPIPVPAHEHICYPNGKQAFDDCCHDIHCVPCQIDITPSGVLRDGVPASITGLDALRPITHGAYADGTPCHPEEWCCTVTASPDVPHHCMFYFKERQRHN